LIQFTVSAKIKEATGSIVRAGPECVAVREESVLMKTGKQRMKGLLDSIDIGFVARKCLNTSACANIPNLGSSITGARDKNVLIW
jgi:hypothetical protein